MEQSLCPEHKSFHNSIKSLEDKVEVVDVKVTSILTVLQGEVGKTGMVSQVNKNTTDVNSLFKLLREKVMNNLQWRIAIIAAVISGIGGLAVAFFN